MNARDYRIAASCFEPDPAHDLPRRREALRAHVSELLTEVRPDLAVLPEVVVASGLGKEARWGAEPVAAGTVPLMAELAAAFKTNLCVPIVEDDHGTLYNTAVYVDRSGGIAGTYRKRVLTLGELEEGLRPGAAEQPPVVLDGLRIGTAICFDENFPDQIWSWIEAGVDLLVFPSYTFAGELMRAWAIHCAVPLVCAFPWESVIYDRDGGVLARAGSLTTTVQFGHHPRWIAATLSFRRRIYHLDYNQEHLKELRSRYGAQVDICTMERDGRFMIAACADDVDLDAVERELGLTPLQTYLRDARAANRKASNA
jgi:predicted amidohydrolase